MADLPISAALTGTSVLTAQMAQRLAAQPLLFSGAGTLTSSLDQINGLRPSINAQVTAQLPPSPQITAITPRTLK